MKNIFLIFFLGLFLNNCGQNDVWTGYVYPDPSNLANYKYVGSFDSLEACRSQCRYAIDVNNYQNPSITRIIISSRRNPDRKQILSPILIAKSPQQKKSHYTLLCL